MAETKDEDKKAAEISKSAAVKQSQATTKAQVETGGDKSRKNLLIVVTVLAVIGAGLLITAVALVMREDVSTTNSREVGGARGGMHITRFGGQPFDGTGRYISTEVTNDSVTTTVYNYKRGVVVAVNKDSIEIAGGGKRTTIKTNSSTVYTDDTKPAVNDTVTVTGTTTDGTITATEVTVQN